MKALQLIAFLLRHRHTIQAFLPMVQQVLKMLEDDEPEAKRLAARKDTTPLQDLTELAVKREPSLTEKVFKI